jgi:hypothetical protein
LRQHQLSVHRYLVGNATRGRGQRNEQERKKRPRAVHPAGAQEAGRLWGNTHVRPQRGYLNLNCSSLLRQYRSREPGFGVNMESEAELPAPFALDERDIVRLVAARAAAAPRAIAALVMNSRLLKSLPVLSELSVIGAS